MKNRIKELRESRQWSQGQLGKMANTTGQMIGYLERGERGLTVEWMTRIARAFGISPADLLSDTDRPHHQDNASYTTQDLADLAALAFTEVDLVLEREKLGLGREDWALALAEQFKVLYGLRYDNGLEGRALSAAGQAVANNVIPLSFAHHKR